MLKYNLILFLMNIYKKNNCLKTLPSICNSSEITRKINSENN